jgi:hypothetical protein
MLHRPEPHKAPCPSCLNVESFSPFNQQTSVDRSSSGTGGSVIKPLRHLARQVGVFALGVRVSTTPSRHPRDNVVASHPEARGGCRRNLTPYVLL